ncbi:MULTISPECIES: isochorismatase family protein [Actinoalloteichus]|uniref:Nicotinamidase-like amidase n=1 Tax=Actinoalloteichus fjordicus TaxID=1612552 RepID=A0AAC9LCB8_9PSEU|nr:MULTISPECIES: isochorismatase family protein [Actinoalloteichus]APU14967.1 nicotinamidase-like amidase [Actinoalloteichus fjordicus]APU21037.1 nicotinamidase-like amidase [Actinoalloteichus sp. GBA129-24]
MSAVLLLIDVQRNMLEAPEPVPEAALVAPVIENLLVRGRAEGARVIHVRNNGTDDDPDLPGTPGWELVHSPRPGEEVVDKRQADAFEGTGLAELLPEPTTLIVAGMQSDYCVRATSLAAVHRGHHVVLVKGAHATYDDPDEKIPARAVSTEIEQELAAAGVRIVAPADVVYS